jgi:hypothetical protein
LAAEHDGVDDVYAPAERSTMPILAALAAYVTPAGSTFTCTHPRLGWRAHDMVQGGVTYSFA